MMMKKKISIKELIDLFGEEFYGIELLEVGTLNILKPIKFDPLNDLLTVISFRINYETQNGISIPIFRIIISIEEYNKLTNESLGYI